VPFTFRGHYQQRFHYNFTGSLGFQAFNETSSAYFPLDPAIQAAEGNLSYPAMTTVSGNYNFNGEASYAISDHWYTGGYMDFNNTRDYASSKVSFFVRYLFRPEPANGETGPTGLYPVTGFRPLNVP
jgi:cellulose synthase operon protein C